MAICITGMHRSGTSLVAQLLHVCGVDLGPEEEFFPADEFNADGYWENARFRELDDAVLEALGGAWDSPPDGPAADERVDPLRATALHTLDELALSDPWGWKDPRASLILPFWLELVPDLRVVACVRHPLEVVRSLHRRGAMSAQLGLSLWRRYNERLLAAAAPERRVVTHYAAYLADARAELERVAGALALDVPAERLAEAAGRVKSGLRHHDVRIGGAAATPLPEDVLALYDELCAEAGVEPEPRPRPGRAPHAIAPLSHRLAADEWRAHVAGLRADRDNWRRAAEGAAAEAAELRAQVAELGRERDELRGQAERLTESRAAWELEAGRRGEARDHWQGEAARVTQLVVEQTARATALETQLAEAAHGRERAEAAQARAEAELAALTEELEQLRGDLERVRTERAELEDRAAAAEAERAALEAEQRELEAAAGLLGEELREAREAAEELREAAEELRESRDSLQAAHDALAGEVAAYATDRDRWREEAGLLREDRDRWQAQAVAWKTEADGLAAARARGLRARSGAAALGVGRALWWLPALLWAASRRLVSGRRARAGAQVPSRWRRLRFAVRRRAFPLLRRVWWALPTRLRDFLRPIIFREARRSRPAVRTFAPPRIDRTPARRQAGTGENREIPRHWEPVPAVAETSTLPPVSVLIPTFNGGPLFERVLTQIGRQEGLGACELVVVDSGSTDGTPEVARRAGANVIEIPQSEFGHGRTRNLAAEASSGEVLMMLVQDAVPLTAHVFRDLVSELLDDPHAAAVSARQLPRSDADLYGAFVVYAHDCVTREDAARALAKPAEERTAAERRALAGLDDVCAAIRRSAWEELRFADVDFAEDLDFGLRAVEAGGTIRLAAGAAVAHSHSRDAVYHFRRGVADRLHVAERLGDDRISTAADAGTARVAAAAVVLAEELEGALRRTPAHVEPDATLDAQLAALARMLGRKPPRMEPAGELAPLVDVLRGENGRVELAPPVTGLRLELLALLAWAPLREFSRGQLVSDPDTVASFVAKLAASAFGRALGDALRAERDDRVAARLLAGI